MPSTNGVVFSDGIENDVIEFNAGSEIDVKIASKKGHLVVWGSNKPVLYSLDFQ